MRLLLISDTFFPLLFLKSTKETLFIVYRYKEK